MSNRPSADPVGANTDDFRNMRSPEAEDRKDLVREQIAADRGRSMSTTSAYTQPQGGNDYQADYYVEYDENGAQYIYYPQHPQQGQHTPEIVQHGQGAGLVYQQPPEHPEHPQQGQHTPGIVQHGQGAGLVYRQHPQHPQSHHTQYLPPPDRHPQFITPHQYPYTIHYPPQPPPQWHPPPRMPPPRIRGYSQPIAHYQLPAGQAQQIVRDRPTTLPPPIGNSPAGAGIPIQLPPRIPPSRAVREHSQAPQPPPIGNSPAGASIPIQLPPRLPPSRAGREHSQAPQPPPELIRNVTSTAQGPLDPPQVPLQPHNEKDLSIKLPQTSHPLVDREHSQQPQVLHHEHFRTPDPHADLGAQHPAEHHQGRLDRETAGDVAVVETADLRSGTASSENVDILSTVGEPSATQAVENIEFSSPIRREEDAEEAPSVIEHTSTNDGNIVEDGHRVPGEVGNLQVAVTNQHPGEREDVALTSLDGATNNTDSVPLDHMQIDEENLGNGRTDIRPSSRTSPETAPEAPEPSALPPKPKTKKKKMSKDRRNAIMQGLPRAATIFKEIAADTDSTYQEVLGVFAESEKDFVVRGENAWNLYETFFNDEQYKPNQIKVTRQKLSLGNDVPVTARMAYRVFMDTQQDPIAALLKHNAIQIEKQEVSLGTRKRIFDDKTDKVENYLQLIAAQHGFHSTLIIAGGNVHSDGGVARVIETPGARGVLAAQYGLDKDVLLAGMKVHAYKYEQDCEMARRGVKLPNSRAPPECYPSGTVGREGLRSADKRKAIQPDAGSPLTTSDDQEERGSLEQSSPSPQERNVHETPRGQLRVFVDIPSPSKSPVKKSRDCIIRAPGKIGMTEAEVTAWFLPTDDSPAAIEFIEKASSNAKQKTAWIIKIAKQKFAEMLVDRLGVKPFATVQEIIKYFPWKRFNINLPQILAILEGWPIDVPSPTSGLGGPKDKGINDLKDAELKSLITSLRERRLSARFCTTAEAGGVSSGEYPIIVGEAPPHGHAKTNGLRVFVDRMDWEGKPQLAKNAPKEQFSPRKSQKSDGEVGVAANVPTKTVVQTKESDVFGIPAGDQKGKQRSSGKVKFKTPEVVPESDTESSPTPTSQKRERDSLEEGQLGEPSKTSAQRTAQVDNPVEIANAPPPPKRQKNDNLEQSLEGVLANTPPTEMSTLLPGQDTALWRELLEKAGDDPKFANLKENFGKPRGA